MPTKILILTTLVLCFALAGCGGDDPAAPDSIETAVGAAYPNAGDGRIILIDISGTRSVYFNPSNATFSSSQPVTALEAGNPISPIGAATTSFTDDPMTYFLDADGMSITPYQRNSATFLPTEDIGEYLDDAPFPSFGAAFSNGSTVFFFNEGGTQYAAWNRDNETWSPVYSFTTDFGGGGAPISAVGAAYYDGAGAYILFDLAGINYCIYSGSGQFSTEFQLEDLGDGSLSF